MSLGLLMLMTVLSMVLRKRKVRLGTRIRRRRDGTREPSRCCTVSRYKKSYYCAQIILKTDFK